MHDIKSRSNALHPEVRRLVPEVEHRLDDGELHRVEDDEEQHPPHRKRDDPPRSGRKLVAPTCGSGAPRRSSSCGLSMNHRWFDRLAFCRAGRTRAASLAVQRGGGLMRRLALVCDARPPGMFYL